MKQSNIDTNVLRIEAELRKLKIERLEKFIRKKMGDYRGPLVDLKLKMFLSQDLGYPLTLKESSEKLKDASACLVSVKEDKDNGFIEEDIILKVKDRYEGKILEFCLLSASEVNRYKYPMAYIVQQYKVLKAEYKNFYRKFTY